MYVFKRDEVGWAEDAILFAPTQGFGQTIAVEDHEVVVGASSYDYSRGVFIYVPNEGGDDEEDSEYEAKMVAEGIRKRALLVASIAVDGVLLVATAPHDRNRVNSSDDAGTLYLY